MTRFVGLLVVTVMSMVIFGGVIYADPPDEGTPLIEEEPTWEIEFSPSQLQQSSSSYSQQSSSFYSQQGTGWTCEHDVHYPHNSGHFLGRINVEGETTCNVTMNNIIVTVELQKKACLWRLCVWNTIAVTNPPEEGQTYVIARANIPCEPGEYRGRINSTLIWPNGDWSSMYWIGVARQITCDQ